MKKRLFNKFHNAKGFRRIPRYALTMRFAYREDAPNIFYLYQICGKMERKLNFKTSWSIEELSDPLA